MFCRHPLFVFVCDYYNPLDLRLNDVRFTIEVTTLYFRLIPNTLNLYFTSLFYIFTLYLYFVPNTLSIKTNLNRTSYIVNRQIVNSLIPESNQPQSYHAYRRGIYL